LDALAAEAFEGLGRRGGVIPPAHLKSPATMEERAGKPRPYEMRITELLALDPAIASRVVVLAVQAVGGAADAAHVRQVLEIAAGDDPSAETTVRGGVRVRRVYDTLVFERTHAETPTFQAVVLPERGTISLPDAGLRITVGADFSERAQTISTFCFKSAAICGRITVRPRQTGDTLRPPGRGGTKSVKKWMIDAKIPARERETCPVFADEAGVIAVCGLGIDARVAPTAGDKTVTIVLEDM